MEIDNLSMKEIKAVFFDVDKTIYDPIHNFIPESTLTALKKLRSNGYKIGISTSRPMLTARAVPGLMDIPWDGMIIAGGQQIYSQGQLVLENTFTQAQRDQIFQIANRHHIPVYTVAEEVFFTEMNDLVRRFIKMFGIPYRTVKPFQGQASYLICLIHEEEQDILPLFKDVEGICPIAAGPINHDIFKKGVLKSDCIMKLMKYWGYDPHAFMAFGDTLSDAPMLEAARIGVAMGNADIQTRKKADIVCGDYREDGILLLLQSLHMI